MPVPLAFLPDRAVLRLAGPDARPFLQGLVSNDVDRLTVAAPVYAALLTPQGKYLFDFVMFEVDGAVLLDAEAARAADLVRRLMLYRLRAQVEIADVTEALAVIVGPDADAFAALAPLAAAVDPRLEALGARAIVPRTPAVQALADAAPAWDLHRLRLGVPLPPHDLVVEKSLLMESNLEELHGVDFAKGCYVGQELTARMKYRGLAKKRLVPVRIEGPTPLPGTPLEQDGRDAGEMRSSRADRGIALVRLEALRRGPLRAGDATLLPEVPDWLAPSLPVGTG